MSLTDIHPRETADGREKRSPDTFPGSVVGAGVRTVYAAVAGLLLTCSLGVVIWAVTPSSGSGPGALLRAGVAAFSAANGMTVTIGRTALTMPPLMITLVAIALLSTVSGRGRAVTTDRVHELASTGAAAAVYAAVVTSCGVVFGPTGAVSADQWWRPALLALAVVGCTTVMRGVGWRSYLHHRLPHWVPVSVRLGAVGTVALIGAGGVTVVIGLMRSWNDATTVASLAAPGAGGGFGMTLLGMAYLPNAVIAGAGYASGVGFTVGNGTYSPFGSSPTELPAVTLLTAVPDSATYATSALLILILPLLAAVFMGRGAVRRLERRNDRMLAVAAAALAAGIASGLLAAVASGGVAGGAWSSIGVPPLPFAVAVTLGLGVVGVGIAALGRVSAETASPTVGSGADEPGADEQMSAEALQDGEVNGPDAGAEVVEAVQVETIQDEGEVVEDGGENVEDGGQNVVEDGDAGVSDDAVAATRVDDIGESAQVDDNAGTVQIDHGAAPVGEEPDPPGGDSASPGDDLAADAADGYVPARDQLGEIRGEALPDQTPGGPEEAPVAVADGPGVSDGVASHAREGG